MRQQSSIYYLLKDHLGSIMKIVDNQGTTIEEHSYNAWGNHRDPANWNNFTNFSSTLGINRGYTGHEMLPGFQLINMNGRMYDPVISRMLSPDKFVQFPENAQSYNKYSYALNNPLKYTDPSGWLLDGYSIDKNGNIKWINDAGGNEYDVLFSLNNKGSTNNFFQLEKGILKEGMNFMFNDNVIEVGGKGQATREGFENFIIKFSDMIDKEVGGYYFTPKGRNEINNINLIYVGQYQYNTERSASAVPRPKVLGYDWQSKYDINTRYHTHLSKFPESVRIQPSNNPKTNEGDIPVRNNQMLFGIKRFIILTTGCQPIPY